MNLETILQSLMDNPGATRLPRGLGLAYTRRDGNHRLAMSRLRPQWPSETEQQTIVTALAMLGHRPEHFEIEHEVHVDGRGRVHNLIRLSWPMAVQMEMPMT